MVPETTVIEERVLMFVQRELLDADGAAVDRDTYLLSGELLDSMSVLRLAAFVGEAFKIDTHPADFVIDNFRDVAAIAAYVRRRLADSRR